MGVTEKTAILVISFGTSYEETRKKTIEQIESCLLYTSMGLQVQLPGISLRQLLHLTQS